MIGKCGSGFKVAAVGVALLMACAIGFAGATGEKGPAAAAAAGGGGVFKTEDHLFGTPAEYTKRTGAKIGKLAEAPMLRDMVAAGKLPPLEKRLPEEPLVLKPVGSVGTYGGALNTPAVGVAGWSDIDHGRWGGILRINTTATASMPYNAKGYEVSADGKTFTLYLRKGLKWSDGAPFTVDDILFWWEDITLNKELTPNIPGEWAPGGTPAIFEKVDDYTLRIRFAAPSPVKPIELAWNKGWQTYFFDPKHYLKKWHIKYNPDANAVAKQEGRDDWRKALQYHRESGPTQDDPNLPSLGPWVLQSSSSTQKVYVRNAYYCAVDTAGNQLPYIDKVTRPILADTEVFRMQAVAGQIDFTWRAVSTDDVPVLKKNAEKGGYRIALTEYTGIARVAVNLNHKDPVMRALFQDVRVRRALSLAIKRDAINESVYMGTGVPMADTPHPSVSYYKPEWAKAWTAYDPAQANRLLDEAGLAKRDAEGFRLRPDGKRLVIAVQIATGQAAAVATMELIKEFWEKVGVKTDIKVLERSFFYTRYRASEHDASSWGHDEILEGTITASNAYKFRLGDEPAPAVDWYQWWQSKGKGGTEPPAEIKQFYTWLDQFVTLMPGSPEYKALAQKIFDWFVDGVYYIGLIGSEKRPVVINSKLMNVALDDQPYCWATLYMAPFLPEQWYFKQ